MFKVKDTHRQWIAIGASVVLLFGIFAMDIKGLEKQKKESNTEVSGDASPSVMLAKKEPKKLTIQDILTATHNQSTNEIELHALEKRVAQFETSAPKEQQLIARELSARFFAVSNPGASAYFDEINLSQSTKATEYVQIADKYIDACNFLQNNETLQLSYLNQAHSLYTKALELDKDNLDAKTGQGITIVNGLGMPMQGIALLLEVVEKDPKNLKANMNLGLFSMKSGQFDKAIERFESVISVKPDAESYFYLGTAYENLKQNEKAIEAFLKSKSMAKNSTLNGFIDKKVDELRQREN